MDIRDRAKDDLSGFEKILNKIPGFKGYFDRELRRDADKVQREFVAKKLISVKDDIGEIIKGETRKRDLSLLTEFDTLIKNLEKIIGEIRYSDRGYSGFFDLVKIRETTLDDIYETDLSLLTSVEDFSNEVKSLLGGSVDKGAAGYLAGKLKEVKKILAGRDEILMGFNKIRERNK